MSKVIEVIEIGTFLKPCSKRVVLKSQVIGVDVKFCNHDGDDDYYIILKDTNDIRVSHDTYLEILYFLQN